MEIFINTAKQPPSVAADANGLQLTSSFEFKRGTTVPMRVYLPADVAVGIARLRYGLKLKGRYDDVLVVSAEATEAGTETAKGVPFELKPTFDAVTIDAALAANAVNTDDLESAAFISEFAWENAEAEVTATRTITTKIVNNVIRKGDASESDLPPAQYTAIMAVKISWADYCALPVKREDVLYFIPDAPSEVEAHNADADAHKAQFDAIRELIGGKANAAKIAALEAEVSQKVPLLETVPADGNNNANGFGYVGTLRNLGAFGGAVLVSRLSVFTRSNNTFSNGGTAVWARILKIVDGAWVVAAQSKSSAKWDDYTLNAEIPFEMQAIPGVVPPSADETIAIVFVNSETAEAGASNGTLSFRTVTLQGGIGNQLNAPDNLNAGNSWSPRIKLRFAAMSGDKQLATKAEFDALVTRVEALEAQHG